MLKPIPGVTGITLTFDDLISLTSLKITATVTYEANSSNQVSEYEYYITKDGSVKAKNKTTSNEWTATGLTVGEQYKIYVVVYNNEGKGNQSEEIEYTKKAVYSWNKYEARQDGISGYDYEEVTNTYDSKYYLYYNTTFKKMTDLENCFDSTTGEWTADNGEFTLTSSNVSNPPGGYISYQNYAWDLRNVRGFSSGNSSYTSYSPVKIYESHPVYGYVQDSETPISEPVKSNDEDAYPTEEDGGYQDGYWWIKINN